MDKGARSGTWTATSCSGMFTYALSPVARQGCLAPHFAAVARRGYQGVLAKLSVGSDGRTELADISVGTNVGELGMYIECVTRLLAVDDILVDRTDLDPLTSRTERTRSSGPPGPAS